MEKKNCSKCKIEKSFDEFVKSGKTKSGIGSICKICNNIRGKIYREKNYKKILEKIGVWRRNNPEWTRAKNKRYYDKHPEKVREIARIWREKNKDKEKQYKEKYKPRKRARRKERQQTDSVYVITNSVRCRLIKYLKKLDITKRNKTFEIVGCTPKELKEYLEKKFKDGMSWENRNEWHIDHIIPLSSATTEEELYKLCHHSNLQPLWAVDNIKKGNKIL